MITFESMESIILLFDFTRGSVSASVVESLAIIIPFDIFKESQVNLFIKADYICVRSAYCNPSCYCYEEREVTDR